MIRSIGCIRLVGYPAHLQLVVPQGVLVLQIFQVVSDPLVHLREGRGFLRGFQPAVQEIASLEMGPGTWLEGGLVVGGEVLFLAEVVAGEFLRN